ncbi:hypothetical protein DL93DRAFT_605123 [Clavulina sp. PMI_390]|nr:hypothetical protein DL93DRAFT_605123 [Clavulina sp. PMI_390]
MIQSRIGATFSGRYRPRGAVSNSSSITNIHSDECKQARLAFGVNHHQFYKRPIARSIPHFRRKPLADPFNSLPNPPIRHSYRGPHHHHPYLSLSLSLPPLPQRPQPTSAASNSKTTPTDNQLLSMMTSGRSTSH